jgi:hypothetical protein
MSLFDNLLIFMYMCYQGFTFECSFQLCAKVGGGVGGCGMAESFEFEILT